MTNQSVRVGGYSLLELLFAIGLVALLMALTVVSFTHGGASAGSRGLAEVMAEELRAARLEAVGRRMPVAVVFPSGGGVNPISKGFYVFDGRDVGRLRRSQKMGPEYSKGALFVGSWPTSGSLTFGTVNVDVPIGSSGDGLDFSEWLPTAHKKDPALIFLPSGRVRSRNIVPLGGNYCLISAQGFSASGSTLQGASKPYSIFVSPLGEVSVTPGVMADPGYLAQDGLPLPAPAPQAGYSNPANGLPVIEAVYALPSANPSVYSDGSHSVADSVIDLYPEKTPDTKRRFANVSLLIYASDPDGGQLRYDWTSKSVAGSAGTGHFSCPSGSMEWLENPSDPSKGWWVSSCDWAPPVDATGADRWEFHCDITDPEGNTVNNWASGTTQVRMRVVGQGRIAFDKYKYDAAAGFGQDAIYTMNMDGTGITEITNLGNMNESAPDWAPAGDWLAFHACASSDWASDIFICTGDGKMRENLTRSPGVDELYPKWSPRGNRVAFYRDGDNDGLYGVHLVDTRQGASVVTVETDCNEMPCYPPSWSPNGRYLAYLKSNKNLFQSLYIRDYRATAPSLLRVGKPTHNFDVCYAKWSPLGNKILAVTWDGQLLLMTVDQNDASNPGVAANTDPPVVLIPASKICYDADWDPSGTKIVVSADMNSTGHLDLFLLTNLGAASPTVTQLTSGCETQLPVFSVDGNYVIVQNSQPRPTPGVPVRAWDPYKLFRVAVNPLPTAPWTPADIPLLSEVSADVGSHCVSR